MDTRAAWSGTVDAAADALSTLLENGKLKYVEPSDPVDEDFMNKNMPGLKKMFAEIPKGNGKYSMFVRAVLKLMTDVPSRYRDVPPTRKMH